MPKRLPGSRGKLGRTYREMMSDEFPDGAGFICGFADHDPCGGSNINNLHVAATTHGRGIGTALMLARRRRQVAGKPVCQQLRTIHNE